MLDPDATRGVRKPWQCDAGTACTPRHRLDRPLDPSRLAPSAESDALLDGGELDVCPMHDLGAAATLVQWWRLCDGKASELRAVGIDQPSAAMTDAWLILGDEIRRIGIVTHRRAAEEAKRKRDAAAAGGR